MMTSVVGNFYDLAIVGSTHPLFYRWRQLVASPSSLLVPTLLEAMVVVVAACGGHGSHSSNPRPAWHSHGEVSANGCGVGT